MQLHVLAMRAQIVEMNLARLVAQLDAVLLFGIVDDEMHETLPLLSVLSAWVYFTRSSTVAIPWPTPMHIVQSAYLASRSLSS